MARNTGPEQWRLIYVSDPSGNANYDFDPGNARPLITSHPARPEELQSIVDHVAANGADTFIQEVYNAGWTMYFRSDRFEYDARPQHRRFISMMDQGIMPLQVMLDQARQQGMVFLAGLRMNDNHGAPDQGAMWLHENPQWKLWDMPAGAAFVPGNQMDFTFDGVRDYLFAVMEEIVDRFDVDGLELVFREGLYFPAPGGDWSIARQRQPLMTELIGRVRQMLDAAGGERGRHLQLGVRVPQTLEECHNGGLDVPAWIEGGLVDYVAPQDMMYTDFNAHYDEFSELTRDLDCQLIPGALPYCSHADRTAPPLTLENYRALARTFAGEGADGISMYNFQMHWDSFWKTSSDPGPITMYPLGLSYLRDLRDPERIDAGPRHYLFHSMWGGFNAFGVSGMTVGGVVRDEKIVLQRDRDQPYGQYHFRLYEDFDELVFAKLFFRAVGLGPNDRMAVDINGAPVPDEAVRRIWHSGGRPKHMGRVLPAYTTCIIDMPAASVLEGANALGVRLLFSGLPEGEVVIDEVEITALPRL